MLLPGAGRRGQFWAIEIKKNHGDAEANLTAQHLPTCIHEIAAQTCEICKRIGDAGTKVTTLTPAGRALLAASAGARRRNSKTKAQRRDLALQLEELKARAGGKQVSLVKQMVKERDRLNAERADKRRRENSIADLTWHREVAQNVGRGKRQR